MRTMEAVNITAPTPLAVLLVAAGEALTCLHWTSKLVMVIEIVPLSYKNTWLKIINFTLISLQHQSR